MNVLVIRYGTLTHGEAKRASADTRVEVIRLETNERNADAVSRALDTVKLAIMSDLEHVDRIPGLIVRYNIRIEGAET